MFTPRTNETTFLLILRWSARLLGVVTIGSILLFVFHGGLELGGITWQQRGALILFPLGLLAGLILAWRQEFKGGALAVASVTAFYLVFGLALNDWFGQGWWFIIFAGPGILFLLYGLIERPHIWRKQRRSSDKLRGSS